MAAQQMGNTVSYLKNTANDFDVWLPSAVSGENAERTSATEARLSWNSQNDAMGYCIRLGIAPDKLYNSILLYGQNDYTVTFLNKETEKYYFAVDSFNESGITKGSINEF